MIHIHYDIYLLSSTSHLQIIQHSAMPSHMTFKCPQKVSGAMQIDNEINYETKKKKKITSQIGLTTANIHESSRVHSTNNYIQIRAVCSQMQTCCHSTCNLCILIADLLNYNVLISAKNGRFR